MMRALVVEGPGQAHVRDVPVPEAGRHALVRVERTGLCGTDLKIINGDVRVKPPRVIGHEIVGRVEVAGAEGRIPAGTRVLVDPNVSCGHCPVCRADRPHLCPEGGLIGRDADGGAATYVPVAEDHLHPLPEDLGHDAAALLQVLSTCLHAQEQADVFPGRTTAVIGLGVTGLLHTQLLRLRGATVIGVTRSAAKREKAEELGAETAVPPDAALETVAELTGGIGADLVVECAGTQETLSLAMQVAAPGGTVLCYGTITPYADRVPTYLQYLKELRLLGTRSSRPRDFTAAITLARGPLRLAGMVTAAYPLDQAADAIKACADPTQLKVVLDP